MTVRKETERQYPLVSCHTLGFDDLLTPTDLNGVAAPMIDVPADSTVVGGEIVVDTAWNSGTSDVLDLGDGDDTNRYLAAVDLTSTGRTALTLTGYKYASADTVDLIWTAVGADPTAGSARIYVWYIIEARGHEAQT